MNKKGLVFATAAAVIVAFVAGAVIYVPSAFLFAGDTSREFVRLVRNALRRRAA